LEQASPAQRLYRPQPMRLLRNRLAPLTRRIVQLKDAPLATYTGGAGLSGTANSVTGAAKLDVNSKPSQAYIAYLTGKQTVFKAELAKVAPDAQVQYSYQVTFNGLAVALKTGQIEKVSSLPGVAAVTLEQEHKVDMDASLPLIGAGTGTVGGPDWVDSGLWAALGGHANAGTGLKIADIDTGISYKNPCFDPAGFTYPAGFPKYGAGYEAFVNPKIIAARAYFRPQDPPKYDATPEDDPLGGHGSHTAGTMACNYGVTTGESFLNTAISGLAPKAQLMVYRIFYSSISGSQSGYTPELIAAIEDVVKDGADLVNNSWGGTSLNSVNDPEIAAYSAAVDAGVVVVFSAGNSGSGSMTVGNPGLGEKFITVANSTTNRMFAQLLNVTGPAPDRPDGCAQR
jgi:minor extracellular serine protease Vpr